jgi:hypothetical protein
MNLHLRLTTPSRFRTLGLNPFNVFKKKEAPTKSLKIHLESVQDTDYVMDLTRKESSESRAPRYLLHFRPLSLPKTDHTISALAEAAMEPSNIGSSQPISEARRIPCTATECVDDGTHPNLDRDS